ncbi:molybdate transport system ATP-binding protein [Larkinella arboricola]|uniref:Molybdate transport system ATP-binding protein n=1 Tax=Larkinella arboricola TaxID=643671 RepID=A0A327WL82_LARAB|nr:ATP-binding cassette domain-containing protein [Larkinella arboricola]RAJ92515.1 molybdate transport system ATP-binding protein [Larkinella arboricola]
MTVTPLLSLQNATVRRPTGLVLQHLDWSLRAGENWAVLGATGSGKSSLLDALSGRIPVADGQYRHPVGPLREAVEQVANDYQFDRKVASSAQFYQQRFNADAAEEAPTVWEVLQNQIKPTGTIDAQSVTLPPPAYPEAWLAEVAEWVHITHLMNRRLTSLSNGETRRTLLARSLLRRPKILLLDNPFGGLDVASRERLHGILNRIAAEGTTLVLATTPREIPDCITHVAELADGQINWQGPKADRPALSESAPETLTDPALLPRWLNTSASAFEYAIRMRNVTVNYGEKTVLEDINWQVRRGDKWAVLGPNGSGKSTLLSLITADNPQGYRNDYELFDRKRGSGESIWDIKRNIGFVSPELHLYFPREQSVWKVVASGLFDTAGLFRKTTPEQTEQIDFMLDLLRIQHLRDKRLSQLSTGEQRWVLLARALVKNPPLLVLDEPCQNLDPAHIIRFRDLVDELCQSSDRTLLYVSHYAEEIPRCVTQVLRLDAGKGSIEAFD